MWMNQENNSAHHCWLPPPRVGLSSWISVSVSIVVHDIVNCLFFNASYNFNICLQNRRVFFNRFSWLIKNKFNYIVAVLFCLPFLIFLKLSFKYLFKKNTRNTTFISYTLCMNMRYSKIEVLFCNCFLFQSCHLFFWHLWTFCIVLRGASWRCLCFMHKWKIKAINDVKDCDLPIQDDCKNVEDYLNI